jgi:hypothetical protein
MRTAALLLGLIVLLGAAGCGSTQTIDTTKTLRGEPVGLPSTTVELLKSCVETAGARLEQTLPRPTKERVDGRAALSLPYLGAVAWPNGAFSDVWLAFSPAEARMTAERLNRAEAEAQGVSKVNAAFAYGRVVSAPGNIEQFAQLTELEKAGELPPETVAKVDACMAETNTHPGFLR